MEQVFIHANATDHVIDIRVTVIQFAMYIPRVLVIEVATFNHTIVTAICPVTVMGLVRVTTHAMDIVATAKHHVITKPASVMEQQMHYVCVMDNVMQSHVNATVFVFLILVLAIHLV
jgi:hypothetical protein